MKRREGTARFVALHHWMLKSTAFRALSPNAKAVLLHVWERHNGSNNGQIVYATREGAEIGLGNDSTARALRQLIEFGFLKVTRDSAFRLKTKEARVWALTAEPVDGRPATKEFMRFSPPGNKTRSHQPYKQSHQPYRDPENSPKIGFTVAPAVPSTSQSDDSQSRRPYTSMSTMRGPRFGDVAYEERTRRDREVCLD
jgi:hypothetical protein